MKKRLAIATIIAGLSVFVFYNFVYEKNKVNHVFEDNFTQKLTDGDCKSTHESLSLNYSKNLSFENFQSDYCSKLKGNEMKFVLERTFDNDLDADDEYTVVYKLNPDISEGRYLVVDLVSFYEDVEITNLSFSNNSKP